MKLATYDDGSRDGQLVVVSRDLRHAHFASGIVTRMQSLLDDWNFLSPQLQTLADQLDAGRAPHPLPFEPRLCLAPLPRALAWRPAGDRAGWAPGERMLGAHARLGLWPQRLECQPVALCDELGPDPQPDQALEAVRLLGVALHALADEVPFTVWAPVVLTPDELGPAWRRGRLQAQLRLRLDNRTLTAVGGAVAAAAEGQEPGGDARFGAAIAQAAAGRGLGAGAVVGAGPWLSAELAAEAAPQARAEPAATGASAEPIAAAASAEPIASRASAEPIASRASAEPIASRASAEPTVATEPRAALLRAEFRLGDPLAEPFGRIVLSLPARPAARTAG